MKGNSKKAVFFFIILLFCLAAIGAISAYIVVRATTPTEIISADNKENFMKYISQNNLYNVLNLDEINEIFNRMDTSSYEIKSNISVTASENMLGSYDLNKMNFEIHSKNDPNNQLGYLSAKLKYATNDIIEFQEIKDGNKFGIKSDDIVVKYVGVNLDNIRSFLPKLGFNTFDNFPADFDTIKIGSLMSYDKDFVSNRLDIYLKLLTNELDFDRFTLQKNVEITTGGQKLKADAYSVVLTDTELQKFEGIILSDIIQDDDLIGILVEKYNSINANKHTNESMKVLIQNKLIEINQTPTNDTEKFKFSIYVAQDKVVKVRADIYEYADFEADLISSNNTEELNVTFLKKNRNGYNFSIKNKSGKELNLFYGVIENGEISKKYEANVTNSGNINSNSIKNNIVLDYKENNNSTTVNLENEITFGDVSIDKLTDENCLFIDSLSEEDFNTIKTQIINQIIKIYKEKMLKMDVINQSMQSTVVSNGGTEIVIDSNSETTAE